MKRRRSGGFTLIETIVAMLLLSIFLAAATAAVAPVLATFRRVNQVADAQLVAGNIMDTLRGEAATARELLAFDREGHSALDTGNGVFYVSDGQLMLDDLPYYAQDYYGGKTLGMTFAQLGRDCVAVTLWVMSDGQEICSLDGVLGTLRGVLGRSYSIYEPEGMLQTALEAAAAANGTRPNEAAFSALYNDLYQGAFPAYDIENILSAERIQTLYQAALAADGPYANTTRYYQDLLSQTYSLAVHIVPGSRQAIVYITSNPALYASQSHSSAAMIYHNYTWYAPVNNREGYFLPGFNNMTDQQIGDALANTERWRPISQLR